MHPCSDSALSYKVLLVLPHYVSGYLSLILCYIQNRVKSMAHFQGWSVPGPSPPAHLCSSEGRPALEAVLGVGRHSWKELLLLPAAPCNWVLDPLKLGPGSSQLGPGSPQTWSWIPSESMLFGKDLMLFCCFMLKVDAFR